MITLHPFKALMPLPAKAHLVAAPPYDVVSRQEALECAQNNSCSFLHVSRSEIDLPEDVSPYSDEVYARAVENFERLKQDAPLVTDTEECFYVYSLTMNGRSQIGLVAATSVDDYDSDRIKKHELTRKDKEDDRTRHIMELNSHTGPVFLTCNPTEAFTSIMDDVMAGDSALNVQAEDGVVHEIWRVPSSATRKIIDIFKNVSSLYVADGHHRAKSASRTREALRNKNSSHEGNEAYNLFLSVIFSADQLHIFPYNRIVMDLNGMTTTTFLENLRVNFKIEKTTRDAEVEKGTFHMYLPEEWSVLTPLAMSQDVPIKDRLDVSILQNQLLQPILGIGDPRTEPLMKCRYSFRAGLPLMKQTMLPTAKLPEIFEMSKHSNIAGRLSRPNITPNSSTASGPGYWIKVRRANVRFCDAKIVRILSITSRIFAADSYLFPSAYRFIFSLRVAVISFVLPSITSISFCIFR